jgi:hypothetical protein
MHDVCHQPVGNDAFNFPLFKSCVAVIIKMQQQNKDAGKSCQVNYFP